MRTIAELFFLIIVFGTLSVYGQDIKTVLPLFSANQISSPEFSRCNKADSKQWIESDPDEKTLTWTWKDKPNDFCGWGIRITDTNLQPYFQGYTLTISITKSSSFDHKNPPLVKFIDFEDKPSASISINDKYIIKSNPSTDLDTYKIPLTEFYTKEKFLQNMKYLQFEAPWESVSGKLIIKELTIDKK